jgi:ATP-dependent Lhr-like helicase
MHPRTGLEEERLRPAHDWFAARGWTSFSFQQDVWRAYLAGESGLIHAPTGTGKTQAAWWGPLLEWLAEHPDSAQWSSMKPPKLRVLWITPMRALAADTERSLLEPVTDRGLPWTVQRRTGDTSATTRTRQLARPPSCLITTPESLSLLLTQPNGRDLFRDLQAVIVDEWHELLGNKRGVQTELCLARLRHWRPGIRLWGLSATLGNLEQAMSALLGPGRTGRLIQGQLPKDIVIDTLIPAAIGRFPWAGHLGLTMVGPVLEAVDEGRTALVFTNTRNQAERWYQALLDARPDWAGLIALHHGSLSADARRWVEDGLRAGTLCCAVATSSLDLGVDFSPVDRVLQIGSPKGVARLLQRAGRSGHQPGAASRVTCVPTNALELVEAAAARDALGSGLIEAREPVDRPLDVLVQHLVTVALGGGFAAADLLAEVRDAYAYRELTDAEWAWALNFVVHGGESLGAYPEYQRVVVDRGHYWVQSREVAGRHRLSIGTIVGESSIDVRYQNGRSLGSIQESFISRLKSGDTFVFAGKKLEFIRVQDMTAWVRPANRLKGVVPAWTGTSLPISPVLGDAVRAKLAEARDGIYVGAEMEAVRPILELQKRVSALPRAGELLIEQLQTRDGHHLFVYPFAGKLVNQGLAALFAFRLSRKRPITFTLTANDYGFELLAPEPVDIVAAIAGDDGAPLFATDTLLDDIRASLNGSEMAQRQFREIARIAGLIFQGFPGQKRKARHLQASSSLFFEVFSKYDAGNLLLAQAYDEVLTRQLEQSRLHQTLLAMRSQTPLLAAPVRPTPLCFPLHVERMQASLSSESVAERVKRLTLQLESWAG